MFHLTLFVTAHSEKERLEWEEVFIDKILRLVDGVSVYDGYGAFRMKDGSIMKEHHSRIEVFGEDAHEIHKLYTWIYPDLLDYLFRTEQECVLVLMNGNSSLIYLEDPTPVLP